MPDNVVQSIQRIRNCILQANAKAQAAQFEQLAQQFLGEESIESCILDVTTRLCHRDESVDAHVALLHAWLRLMLCYLAPNHARPSFSQQQLYQLFQFNRSMIEIATPALKDDITACVLHCTLLQTQYVSIGIQARKLEQIPVDNKLLLIAELTQWYYRVFFQYYLKSDSDGVKAETLAHFKQPLIDQVIDLCNNAWHIHDSSAMREHYRQTYYLTTHRSGDPSMLTHELQYELGLVSIRVMLLQCQQARVSNFQNLWYRQASDLLASIQLYCCALGPRHSLPSLINDLDNIFWMILPNEEIKTQIIDLIMQTTVAFKQMAEARYQDELWTLQQCHNFLTQQSAEQISVSSFIQHCQERLAQTGQIHNTLSTESTASSASASSSFTLAKNPGTIIAVTKPEKTAKKAMRKYTESELDKIARDIATSEMLIGQPELVYFQQSDSSVERKVKRIEANTSVFSLLHIIVNILSKSDDKLIRQVIEMLANKVCDKASIEKSLSTLVEAIHQPEHSKDTMETLLRSWLDVLLRYLSDNCGECAFSFEQLHQMLQCHMQLMHVLNSHYLQTLRKLSEIHDCILICILHCNIKHLKYFSISVKIKKFAGFEPAKQLDILSDFIQWQCYLLHKYILNDNKHNPVNKAGKSYFITSFVDQLRELTSAWQSVQPIAVLLPANASNADIAALHYELPFATLKIYLEKCQAARLADQTVEWRTYAACLLSTIFNYNKAQSNTCRSDRDAQKFNNLFWLHQKCSDLKKPLLDIIIAIIQEFHAMSKCDMSSRVTSLEQIHRNLNKTLKDAPLPAKTGKKHKKKVKAHSAPVAENSSENASAAKAAAAAVVAKKIPATDKKQATSIPSKPATPEIVEAHQSETPQPLAINTHQELDILNDSLALLADIKAYHDHAKQSLYFTLSYDEARKLLGQFLERQHLNYDSEITSREALTQLWTYNFIQYFSSLYGLANDFSSHYPAEFEVSVEQLTQKARKQPRANDLDKCLLESLLKQGCYHERHCKGQKPKRRLNKIEPLLLKQSVPLEAFSEAHCQEHAPKFFQSYQQLLALFLPLLENHPEISMSIKGGFAAQSLFALIKQQPDTIEIPPCDIDLHVTGVTRSTFLKIAHEFNLHALGLAPCPFIDTLCTINHLEIAAFSQGMSIDIVCVAEQTEITEQHRDFCHHDMQCQLRPQTGLEFHYASTAVQDYFRQGNALLQPAIEDFTHTFTIDKSRIFRYMHMLSMHGYQPSIEDTEMQAHVQALFDFSHDDSADLQLFWRKARQYTVRGQQIDKNFWNYVKHYGFFAKLAGITQRDCEQLPDAFYQEAITDQLITQLTTRGARLLHSSIRPICRGIWQAYQQSSQNPHRSFHASTLASQIPWEQAPQARGLTIT